MEKYTIVATKGQKRYTLIVSAESQDEAKQKLHKDGYTILSVGINNGTDIVGKKFIFQAQIGGELKNGVIIGNDIFKVYIKLKDELGYNVIFLYPEGDEAHNNAQKKQEIMDQLIAGYEYHKKNGLEQEHKKQQEKEEQFYINKQLQITRKILENILEKFDLVIQKRDFYEISDEEYKNIENIYEKLIHIKSSTNLIKLKEISEIAAKKILEIQERSLKGKKNEETQLFIDDTQMLLKQIGVKKEIGFDLKKELGKFFTVKLKAKENIPTQKENLVDKDSYAFLKNLLLLEKYKEKLKQNTHEILSKPFVYLNPFSKGEEKTKIFLKRKVIEQNISLLEARKKGNISSYTSIKKGVEKIKEEIYLLKKVSLFSLYALIILFSFLFLLSFIDIFQNTIYFSPLHIFTFFVFFALILGLELSKGFWSFHFFFVFFSLCCIVLRVNFY